MRPLDYAERPLRVFNDDRIIAGDQAGGAGRPVVP
jgi:hypothetical protein